MKGLFASRGETAIQTLHIRFYLRDNYISIGSLVNNALVSGKVGREAELAILTDKFIFECTDDDLRAYAQRFRSLLDDCPNAFGGLTSLELYSIYLLESDINNILSTCKKLELLKLDDCKLGTRTVLQIKHPRLTRLTFYSCDFESVNLHWLPKLKWLTCSDWTSLEFPLSYGYVPCLGALMLYNAFRTWHRMQKLSELLIRTGTITELHLSFKGENIWFQPEGSKRLVPVFHKLNLLKILNVHDVGGFSWTMFLLEAAPVLKELHVQVWNHVCEVACSDEDRAMLSLSKRKNVSWEVAANFKHHNLTRLAIIGFQRTDKGLLRYIRSIMDIAVNLEEIRLSDNFPCGACDKMYPGIWCSTGLRFPQTNDEKEMITDQINDGQASPIKVYFS